jgi:hypothetical protein
MHVFELMASVNVLMSRVRSYRYVALPVSHSSLHDNTVLTQPIAGSRMDCAVS